MLVTYSRVIYARGMSMPRVKGLHLAKLRAQPPVTTTATPLAGGRQRRRPNGYGPGPHKVTHYCGYIGASSTLAIISERDAAELRMYRYDLARCTLDECTCYCRCHTGDVCDGPIDRVHTPGHKPTYVTVLCDALNKCQEDGYWFRHKHVVTCHDRVDQTNDPRHIRKG